MAGMTLRPGNRGQGLPLSLPGATAAARFVGATTGGPPTTGTFAAGDWIVDQTGNQWVCTVAGTPGTWLSVGSGREIGYAQGTSNFTKTTAGAGAEDITGMSVTINVASRPVMLHWWADHLTTDTAGNQVVITIADSANTVQATSSVKFTAVTDTHHLEVWARVNPAAGSYTYKARMNVPTGGGKGGLVANSTAPMFLRAVEV